MRSKTQTPGGSMARICYTSRQVVLNQPFVLILLTMLLLTGNRVRAQNPVQSANAELRTLFSNLNNPNPTVRFLYDMSAKVTDSLFYTQISYDTSNVDNWYFLYDEMYHAAYDTNLFVRSDTIFQRALPKIQNDTIPIGIFDWRFNRLKPDALTTNNYFDFDTVNNVLTDKVPQPVSPYDIDTIFAISPLAHEAPYANVTFQFDPQFFFTDPTTPYHPDARTLKIDFDDGNGWVNFSVYSVTNHSVVYSTSGDKIIKAATFNTFTGQMITHAVSTFHVISTTVSVDPDTTINVIPGLEVGVYEGCQASAERKFVVYLEGMDLLNNRNIPEIYTDMINNADLAELQNFGYTFLVVNFNNPYAPIQQNGMNVVQLLDYLKCISSAPVVLIGESMGGLIGRYALLHMESSSYSSKRCLPGSMHNTRLFITIDSPHDGANIPLGIQQLYRNLAPFTYMFSSFTAGMNNQYGLFLDGTSSKQMLIYHVDTDIMPGSPISISPYGPSSVRNQLEDQFLAWGDYPRYCKMMALSNGALDGSRQRQYFNETSRNFRQPNDYLMRLKSDAYLKILWFKIIGANTEFAVRTNPDGNGSVLKMSAGISHWKLKLKWFGIKLVWGSTDLVKIEKTALNVRPYCVSAGSILSNVTNPINGEQSSTSPDWAKFLGYTVNWTIDDFGNVDFHSSAGGLGFQFFANINFDFISYSDGFRFGFIPVQSSFGYKADNPDDLDFNIHATTINDIMNRTPFNAVVTNPTRLNRHHLTMDNPELNPYATCNDPALHSTLLGREIGDDVLYLENHNTLPHGPVYEAERNVFVNYRNPIYNYPSVVSTVADFTPPDRFHYVISKDKGLNITGNPIRIRANNSVNINPFDPLAGPYQILPGFMVICCQHFTQINAKLGVKAAPQGFLDLYPNPNDGNLLWVKYRFAQRTPVTASVYNITGQLMGQMIMPFDDNTLESRFSIDLGKFDLPGGIYILQMKGGSETYTKKFSVVK